MIRVVVVGAGLEGLVAAWVFRQHPQIDVTMIDDGARSRVAACVEHRESTSSFFRELGVLHSSFNPNDAVLMRGALVRVPTALMRQRAWHRAMNAYRVKAGLPTMTQRDLRLWLRPQRRLRFDAEELIDTLRDGGHVVAAADWSLEPGRVLHNSHALAFDFAIVTAPLWTVRPRIWLTVPPGAVITTRVLHIHARALADYRRFDRVLLPYTPGGAVHTVTALGGGVIECVARPEAEEDDVLSDLCFAFPDGFEILSNRVAPARAGAATFIPWPEHVRPLGPFAEWRDASLCDVIDGAFALLRRWLDRR